MNSGQKGRTVTRDGDRERLATAARRARPRLDVRAPGGRERGRARCAPVWNRGRDDLDPAEGVWLSAGHRRRAPVALRDDRGRGPRLRARPRSRSRGWSRRPRRRAPARPPGATRPKARARGRAPATGGLVGRGGARRPHRGRERVRELAPLRRRRDHRRRRLDPLPGGGQAALARPAAVARGRTRGRRRCGVLADQRQGADPGRLLEADPGGPEPPGASRREGASAAGSIPVLRPGLRPCLRGRHLQREERTRRRCRLELPSGRREQHRRDPAERRPPELRANRGRALQRHRASACSFLRRLGWRHGRPFCRD